MAMPMERTIEIYLLHEIQARGGSVPARDRDMYDAVARHFPLLTQEDRDLTNNSGENKWKNRVDFARNTLANRGEIDRSTWGVWPITQKGRDRLQAEWPPKEPPRYSEGPYIGTATSKIGNGAALPMPEPNGVAPAPPHPQPAPARVQPPAEPDSEPGERTARETILRKLKDMDDSQFEQFVRRFFARLGHESVNVETLTGDDGVDAECVLAGPFIDPPLTAVWRIRRGAAQLGANAVSELRAAWEGRADRLVLISTEGFTQDAREAARPYRVPKKVGMVTGDELADLMIQKEIGVRKQELVVFELDEAFFGQFPS